MIYAVRDDPKLFIMIGIPGSGKSTWARRVLSHPVISSDDIREEFQGPDAEYDPTLNNKVFETFHDRIDKLLKEGQPVTADATSLDQRARFKLIDQGHFHRAEVHGIFFDNPYEATTRNKERTKKRVPDEAMKVMLEKLRVARSDVFLEPFTTLTFIAGVN